MTEKTFFVTFTENLGHFQSLPSEIIEYIYMATYEKLFNIPKVNHIIKVGVRVRDRVGVRVRTCHLSD